MLVEEGERRVEFALRFGGEPPAGVGDAQRRVVGAELVAGDREGEPETVDEAPDLRRKLEPPVEDDSGDRREGRGCVGEQRPEQHVAAVPGHDHDRAFGETREYVLHRHSGEDHTDRFTLEQGGIAGDEGRAGCIEERGDGWCDEKRIFRDGPYRHRLIVHGRPHRSFDLGEVIGIGPVRDHGEQSGVGSREFGEGQLGDLTHPVGGAGDGSVRRTAAEHEQHRRAEVRGDAGVEREFGGAADIRVIGSEDEHSVALPFDGGEA